MILSARMDAIRKAKELLEHKPVFLDTETTGTGSNDNILEIAVVDHNGKVLVDSLVKPMGKIHPDAIAVHGIKESMLLDAPQWDVVWKKVELVLTDQLVGIYNADFDLRLMQQSHVLNWMQWNKPIGMREFCVMNLYAQFYGEWDSRRGNYRWQSLDAARQQLGIPPQIRHRAKDDALLAREILINLASKPS